jgi:hypothetical protein
MMIISRSMKCPGHLGRGVTCTYKILVRKSERKTPVGISVYREEDNIKIYIQDVGLRI